MKKKTLFRGDDYLCSDLGGPGVGELEPRRGPAVRGHHPRHPRLGPRLHHNHLRHAHHLHHPYHGHRGHPHHPLSL